MLLSNFQYIETMSKYKILWIDDKWEELISFKDVCELPENGFDVVTCTNAEEGMVIFEKLLEDWSGVILDAKVFKGKDSQVDTLAGLKYSIERINKLSYRREVPYYIFTGQPDTASGTAFAEEHEGHYYEKDKDEDKLIADIKKGAEGLEETQIIHRHQVIFDTWPESRHDLLRVLKAVDNKEWQNNSLLNDIRKIMSDVMYRMYDCGLSTVKHDASNLKECSIMLGKPYMEELIPIYVQRAIHTCVDITNPGSHRTTTDKDVMEGKAPYVIRSLVYNMLDVLYWCKDLPPVGQKAITARRVELAKMKYEKEHPKNQQPSNNVTSK